MASPALGQDDTMRGRRRTREAENGDGDDLGDAGDSGATAGSSKKRRRSRKGLDKKFECPHEGCGRSYSRAEHLYRHQLNRKCIHETFNLFLTGKICVINIEAFGSEESKIVTYTICRTFMFSFHGVRFVSYLPICMHTLIFPHVVELFLLPSNISSFYAH